MGHEPFDIREVDVVLADDEDICRAAAVSSLMRFGFVGNRVHEAENGDEALSTIVALQRGHTGKRVPVMVFLDLRMPGAGGEGCARQVLPLFAQGMAREPFVICASSRRAKGDQSLFHCSLGKTFDRARVQYCFELCQFWWSQGGGAPSKVNPLEQIPLSGTGMRILHGNIGGNAQEAPASSRESEVVTQQPAVPPRSNSTPVIGSGCGNTIASLNLLLPGTSPFEDVVMYALVGRGSFGRVYRARWDVSTVALKVVDYYEDSNTAVMAFEGALAANLAHPNLVQTFKYAIRDNRTDASGVRAKESLNTGFEVWIVQEWCSLGTLLGKITRKEYSREGDRNEVVEVAAEVASAANYLHSRGIIHGDLTASNILLCERKCAKGYVAKVSDFGLARVLDNGASCINTATMGTVTYMPPELFQLECGSLTKKVDVYAFGVLTWQLLTGDIPFEGLQPTQVVVMVAQGASLKLSADEHPELKRLFERCVARTPGDRPDFDAVVSELMSMFLPDGA